MSICPVAEIDVGVVVAVRYMLEKGFHTTIRGEKIFKQYYIHTLITVNVFDIICTSLGGENHGIQRRRQKNKGTHR